MLNKFLQSIFQILKHCLPELVRRTVFDVFFFFPVVIPSMKNNVKQIKRLSCLPCFLSFSLMGGIFC